MAIYWVVQSFNDCKISCIQYFSTDDFARVTLFLSVFAYLEAHWLFYFHYFTTSVWLPNLYRGEDFCLKQDEKLNMVKYFGTLIINTFSIIFAISPNDPIPQYCVTVVMLVQLSFALIAFIRLTKHVRSSDERKYLRLSGRRVLFHIIAFTTLILCYLVEAALFMQS